MRNKHSITFKIVAVLTALAVLNSGCGVIEEVLRALGRYCETTDWTVTTTEDVYTRRGSGPLCTIENCSLRQAIQTSNTCPGTQTIHVPDGTYVLTLEGAGEDLNRRGDLDVTDSLNIVGEENPVIDGNHIDRVFDLHNNAVLDITGLIIQHGDSSVDFVPGHGVQGGGGIRSAADTGLHIHASTIRNNTSGIHGHESGRGGGILSWSDSFSLEDSQVIENNGGDGGISVYSGAGTVTFTLENTTVANNTGVGTGGIDILGDVNATFTNFSVQDNTSSTFGIGGIRNTGLTLSLDHGVIAGNRTALLYPPTLGAVGGMKNDGRLSASNLLVEDNTEGGIFNSNVGVATISHSALIDNLANHATDRQHPALTNLGSLTIDNTTISGNKAGGLWNFYDGQVEFSYSTIAANKLFGITLDDGQVKLSNSIIALTDGGPNCTDPTWIVSNGFNLDDAHTCGFDRPGDLADRDPLLQPLALNGGTTPNHALDPASPAIDSASPDRCSGTDQRGIARPFGPACDRGAFELQYQTRPTSMPTATAAASAVPTILLTQNAFCRKGPASAYKDVTAFEKGQSLQIDGRSQDLPRWWWVLMPNSKEHCWVSDATGTVSGNTDNVQVASAPPLPTLTPKSDKGGANDFDKDGYPADQDCDDKNAKVYPGAPETPDDKLDSNCNGDDDK